MKKTLTISDISGGLALTTFGPAQESSYDGGYGFDPDYRSAISSKPGGAITPAGYSKFSSTEIDTAASVNWIITTPKDASSFVYVYTTDGSFVRYTLSGTTYGTETDLGTPTSGAGNGMAYYNNYIYLATPTNISRYGPLNNSPSLTNTVWTGATLGSLTALTDTTYPTFQAGAVLKNPNHAMHVHKDGFLYFCDVISTSFATTALQGRGCLHRISTNKTTDEGDTNNGSAYNVLTLPFGWVPTDIESYGNDLAVLAMPGTGLSSLPLQRGNSALFLWDTFSTIPYKQITLPDPLASSLQNVNGKLYVFSGNTVQGTRVSVYDGGEGVTQVALLSDSMTPMAGAVDAIGDKVYFGGFVSYPAPIMTQQACVYSLGSKNGELSSSALHAPAVTTLGSTAPATTAVKMTFMDNLVRPSVLFAFADSATSGICSFKTGNTQAANFRQRWEIGKPFSVRSLRISLDQAITSGVIITASLLVDNNSTTQTLTTINNTNFSGKTTIAFKRPELTINGIENLTLNLSFQGTVAASVVFPIEIELDVYDVAKTA